MAKPEKIWKSMVVSLCEGQLRVTENRIGRLKSYATCALWEKEILSIYTKKVMGTRLELQKEFLYLQEKWLVAGASFYMILRRPFILK